MKSQKLLSSVVKQLKKEGAKKITVFGPYVRNENKKGSDLDLIVEFKKSKSLLELTRIERELSEKTGIPVDLLTESGISPLIKEKIENDRKVIL